ncbi:hypothetical protein [Streptomyces sp. NPDC053431]|uniref:hypothetical protein n=1 Tax=Streptomyces sp. NPDC053431 TaxID=3365703 RepID=UPI0037D376D5
MSDAMQEALLLSGALFAIVMLTQVGRHSFGWIKFSVSMGFTLYLYWDTYERTPYTAANYTAALVGTLIGAGIGYFLMRTMVVYRNEQKKNKVYTRAGWAYLGIWVAVLVLRTCFLLGLENSDAFAERVGKFMIENNLGSDGIAAFFVMMAMTMVGYRTLVCLIRARRLPPAPQTPSGESAGTDTTPATGPERTGESPVTGSAAVARDGATTA